MLVGIAVFHRHSFEVSAGGFLVLLIYKMSLSGLDAVAHVGGEWRLALNLFGLLLGFAVLARCFEDSHFPEWLPRWLPDGWAGGFALLVVVAVLSTFLDNIAAAVIGGVMAKKVYRGKVGVGFLAAIVAASNAGGAGSVVGDTTTTMLWVAGVPAIEVAKAFIGAAVAVAVSGIVAGRAQHRLQPILKDARPGLVVDRVRLLIVALMIAGAAVANILVDFPALGLWVAIFLGGLLRPIPWREVAGAIKGSLFLIALVLAASLMPVDRLPPPSWPTAFGLGLVSAVFNNIPLTALALFQGGYDWDFVAYVVGYGGSMIWFGSSAGVAISTAFPEATDTRRWLVEGWHVPVAYVLGFFTMLALVGWHPEGP
ncbi:MAG: citrate transporter [Nitrospirae bacterium]|nr:citrate transporter [Nitrospirota bacterium]